MSRLNYTVLGLLGFLVSNGVQANEFPYVKETGDPWQQAISNQASLTGRVVDTEGKPVANVTIRNKSMNLSQQTGENGSFSIAAAVGDVLSISAVGYDSQDMRVASLSTLTVRLSSSSIQVEDVVVTGYTSFNQKKSSQVATVIGSDQIQQVPNGSLDQILQGKVPGMQVSAGSGQPGSSAKVLIRGVGSINGDTNPLYVVDGVPVESNYFQSINPNDIENATVLRDASAKALYGSRGSNGVILITTKKGKAGQGAINYSSQYGFSSLTEPKFRMMNTEQRLRFEEEVGLEIGQDIGPGWGLSALNPDNASMTAMERRDADRALDSLRGLDVDWRDYFFQRGKFMEQQVAFSGGNEQVRYYNSLNYYDQEGIAVRSGLKRYTLRSNVDFNINKLSGGVNIALGYSKSRFTEAAGQTSVGASMASVYYALPYEYPYAPDGTLIHFGNEDDYNILDQREGSAGLERLLNSLNTEDQLKTILGFNLAYQLHDNWKATTRLGLDYRNSTMQDYINPNSYYGGRDNSNTVGGKGRFGEGVNIRSSLISTSGITFQNRYNDVHEVEVSGFYEYVYDYKKGFNYLGYGVDDRLSESPKSITISDEFMPALAGGRTHSTLMSFIGVARYTYGSKYSFIASYRQDGSTKVSPNNRWHGFYSLGANWNVKEETFLKDNSLIHSLNIRASYGTTASPFREDFLYKGAYVVDGSYNGQPAISPYRPANTDFNWEYVQESNIGFDLSLFASNRLRLSADYYNKVTNNMFIDQPPSFTSGYDLLSLSTGKMRNRGFELMLQGDLVKKEDLQISLGINAAYNKNTILHLTDNIDELMDGDSRILKVGLPYGTYFAPTWAGVNPETGDAQYYNLDGSITSDYNEESQSDTKAGKMFPSWIGGFNGNIRWKGLTVDALFSFVTDVQRWNNEDFYNENEGYMTSNQTIRMLEDRWKKPGDNALLQRIDDPRNYSSKDIQDAKYLRLRNLNIGYSLTPNMLSKVGFIKSAKIFAQGQNLFTWTGWRGLDPEDSEGRGRFQYPAARTYTLGLNVGF